jgi:hypothetical protein
VQLLMTMRCLHLTWTRARQRVTVPSCDGVALSDRLMKKNTAGSTYSMGATHMTMTTSSREVHVCNGLAYASTCSSAFSTMAATLRMTVVLHRGSRNADPTCVRHS